LKLGLLPDRDALYTRLDERCAAMFANGLVEEVRHILDWATRGIEAVRIARI
jgi:tRNA A37 N6-isopentenylltransferase MiaA